MSTLPMRTTGVTAARSNASSACRAALGAPSIASSSAHNADASFTAIDSP